MVDNNLNYKTNTHNDDNEILPAGMLSSPHIQFCIDKYKIIKNYDPKCLGPATYNMRIGGDVLAWEKDKKIEFKLEKQEDLNKNIRSKIEFKPNSLTFVTTVEEFNLTKDIIARFNLKSKLVHQGLLLGTGPIVDPQLKARLLIPIHNFSNKTITMEFGQELISVEFTKTSNPDLNQTLKDKKNTKYVDNENWDYSFKKYRERIAGKEVASSVQSQFEAYDDTVKFYEEKLNKITKDTEAALKKSDDTKLTLLNRQMRFNIIGLVAVVVAIAGLFCMSYQLWDSVDSKAVDAYNLVKQFDNNSVDYRSFALKTNVFELQEKITSLSNSLEQLLESDSKIKKEASKLKKNNDILEEKIKTMTFHVKKLEHNMINVKAKKE